MLNTEMVVAASPKVRRTGLVAFARCWRVLRVIYAVRMLYVGQQSCASESFGIQLDLEEAVLYPINP